MSEYQDRAIICIECHSEFIFTAGEQVFYADKGLQNLPKRCKDCKLKKNDRFNERPATVGIPSRPKVAVKCAQCGVDTTVPFLPTQGRPVYCRDCFTSARNTETHSESATTL